MNKLFLILVVFGAITIIPVSYAQFEPFLGEPAYQKSIEITVDELENIQAKHIIASSNNPVTVKLFEDAIPDNISVTNEDGEKLEFTIIGFGNNEGAITISSINENAIIEYNLENIIWQSDNILTLNIGYPGTFSILFSEKTELIFLNNNLIQLGDQKGIKIHGGGYVNVEYYSEVPKIIQEIQWKEDKFNVEIITDAEIDKFNFDQAEKSISFEINEKNKFVTINMEKELLGGPYVILLNNEQISYTQHSINENHISLNVKPESTGEIIIIGTTVIPEFSMFIPLIMGFLIVLTVPFMKKFSLH
jgi:hypothetical protein